MSDIEDYDTPHTNFPHAVGKHVCHVKLDSLHEGDGVSVLLLCFSTETSYEVTGEGYV